LDRLYKIRDEGATACQGPPIFDNYPDSNEEYLLTTSWSREGLEDEGATTRREAPVLDNHPQPDDYLELFLGNYLGLTITSTPQGHFMYWKGLEPSKLLEYNSRLVAESTFRRINPRELEDFDYSTQLKLASQP
jgi:hypothetical protein